jgi:hypothetical protein
VTTRYRTLFQAPDSPKVEEYVHAANAQQAASTAFALRGFVGPCELQDVGPTGVLTFRTPPRADGGPARFVHVICADAA